MYQKVIIAGKLGAKPEVHYTPKNTPVAILLIGASSTWTNEDGSQSGLVCWFRVSALGKLAEFCQRRLEENQHVLVEGVLYPDPQTGGPRVWRSDDGHCHACFDLRAENIEILAAADEKSAAGQNEPRSGGAGTDDWIDGGQWVFRGRCSECGGKMRYLYTDSFMRAHYLECTECGRELWVPMTPEQMQEEGDYSYLEDWDLPVWGPGGSLD